MDTDFLETYFSSAKIGAICGHRSGERDCLIRASDLALAHVHFFADRRDPLELFDQQSDFTVVGGISDMDVHRRTPSP